MAACFVLALFLWPVFVIVPPQATAPALVMVGVLMMQGLARVDMGGFETAAPVVLTLLGTVLTNNLINGTALGTPSHLAIESAVGRAGRVPGLVWGLGAVFVAYAAMAARTF